MNLSLSLTNNMRLTRGASAFTPDSLFAASEAGAWYDPSDLSSMFTDDGVTNVTAAGQAVYRINDKSGNGNHLIQATAAARPLYKTAGGLHWLEFDGTDDKMTVGTIVLTQPNTIYFAHKQTTTGGSLAFFESSAGVQGMYAGFPNAGFMGVHAGSSVNTGIAEDTSDNLDGVLFNGASSTYRRNGASTAISPGAAGLSGTLPIGNNGSTTFYAGRMYQIFLIDTELSAGDRSDLETYLGAKAGLTL